MKLKFRADAKDVMYFILFMVFLLYIVCIGVLNIKSLSMTGVLYGFNPFEAFSKDYLVVTITFYLLFFFGIFISVSSYFFDREKGVGFSTSKNDKGYSRWAKEKEMKKELVLVDPKADNIGAGGIPLINNGHEMWVDNGEYHNLIIGATGSGKTTAVILPMIKVLAKNSESMIITDPKGELYEKTSKMLADKGYNILILNFRNPQNGDAWNPLALPYTLYKSGNQDKAIELLDDLALNILYEESSANADPFWEKTSADYFSGIALGLFEDAQENEININSISLMTTVGEEKFGGSTYVKEYFGMKDPSSAAAINASSTIMAPNETKGSILAVFKQKIKLFASRENLSEMLSHSTIDLREIGKKKTALFIIVQDEKKTYHSLVTILIKQCYETLIDVAQDNGGKLPIRTNFLLDEFANMPPLKDVTTMITAARSRLMRFTMIIQNFAQLNQVYNKENAETIKGNCGNMIYLISTELAALEEISKMCGEVKSKEKDKTSSTPLVTVSDLQKLKMNEVIIRRMRMSPFKTKLTPDYKMDWGKNYPLNTYPIREKKPVKVFDIREFVKEKRKAKMFEMMNDVNGGNPGTNDMFNPNPFLNQNSSNMGNMAPNPFSNSNPNGMSNMNQNPFLNPNNNEMGLNQFNNIPNPNFKNDIDVDSIVKKIDAQIALLEEEERKEKEQQEKSKLELNNSNKLEDQLALDLNKPLEVKNEDNIIDLPKESISTDNNQRVNIANPNDINVDEMIKKIDNQIAILEEEERKEKEQQEKTKLELNNLTKPLEVKTEDSVVNLPNEPTPLNSNIVNNISNQDNINVNEMIKKIDNQIALLEEEGRKEKEQQERTKLELANLDSIKKEEPTLNIPNVEKENIIVHEDIQREELDEDDEKFFDDFFDNEE